MHALAHTVRPLATELSPSLSRLAFERGLAVMRPDGSRYPIPISATPVVIDAGELARRGRLSHHLCQAAFKMAKAALGGAHRDLILGALAPVERRVALPTWQAISRLATARVDFFVAERPWALEVNATIPAMQGYSDIAAHTFIEVVGRRAGLSDSELTALGETNGSNAQALLKGLLAAYAAEREGAPRRMAILCRRNDPQTPELMHMAKRFGALGVETELVHPDELSGEDSVLARGKPFDLVYRHLFVRRLEDNPSPYVEALLSSLPSRKAVVVNPPSAQVEVKATFALLSAATSDGALARSAGLSDDELSAIADSVPWTRPFRPGPAVTQEGDRVPDLVAFVAENPGRFVLKRSWDYGGKAVFLGSAVGTEAFSDRVAAAYGEPLDWAGVCARAAADPRGGGFIVQQRVDSKAQAHLICGEAGVTELPLYVDFSAYASVGLEGDQGWGGVCRGSVSQIVNIVGGGGVLPLLTSEVARALDAALRRAAG